LKADKESEEIILQFEQPYSNHNGGQLAFGPDGYLYIAVGDGGSAGDPQGNGQNKKTLLGTILRIDIDKGSAGLTYAIPPDNPFASGNDAARKEIFAYGLRNPWRFSFDPLGGELWAADVGQNKIEEINIIKRGGNYGWNIMEGSNCYEPPRGCNKARLELPVSEYSHLVGQSITGGYVYRGERCSVLKGWYIYADYISGRVWAMRRQAGGKTETRLLMKKNINISSLGVDHRRELYACAFDGNIYTFIVVD
jgi:glucose/arabinose dehydrogenase